MFSKKSVLLGVIFGFAVPFVAYAILLIINDFIGGLDLMTNAKGEAVAFQFSRKLLASVAICANIIPFQYFKRQYYDEPMRGVMFPTLAYVGLWMYAYADQLGF